MIEKQIHFIWLGNEKIPDEIKAYMKTWSLLEEEGFQVHRWDESNVNMEDVPPVIEAAMKYKNMLSFRTTSDSRFCMKMEAYIWTQM